MKIYWKLGGLLCVSLLVILFNMYTIRTEDASIRSFRDYGQAVGVSLPISRDDHSHKDADMMTNDKKDKIGQSFLENTERNGQLSLENPDKNGKSAPEETKTRQADNAKEFINSRHNIGENHLSETEYMESGYHVPSGVDLSDTLLKFDRMKFDASYSKNATNSFHPKRIIDEEIIEQFLPKYTRPNKYLIYFCHGGCGGLADRQKGIVAGYLMALLTRRKFGINITAPAPFTKYYRPNRVNWIIDPKRIAGLSTWKHTTLSGKDFQAQIPKLNFDKFYTQDVVNFMTNIDFVTNYRKHPLMAKILPAMSFLQNPDVYSIVLHILLKLAPPTDAKLNKIFDEEVQNKHLVCAHLRLGKNPTMADVSRKLRMEETTSLWPFLDRYKNPKNYKIFVAGDSDEIRNIANKRYGKQNIIIPGPIVHIARRNYDTQNAPVAKLRAIQAVGYEKVVLEQNILQRCDTLIVSRSGFNLMALYQRNHSDNLYCLRSNVVLPCVRELIFNIFTLF